MEAKVKKEEKKVEETSDNTSNVVEEMKIEDMPSNDEQRSVEEEIDNRVKVNHISFFTN